MSKINEIYHKVYQTLRDSEEARNSDKRLLWEILSKYYNFYIPWEVFKDYPTFESITRCRRKIQNEELEFQAKENVQISRYEKQEEYKEFARDTINNVTAKHDTDFW